MISPMLKVGALASKLMSFGFKPVKYYVDSQFREKVQPVPGSVLYCDLWLGVEHSGISLGGNQISNIEVEDLAQAAVRVCGPESFTSKSMLGRKIYVSCNCDGPVGHRAVAKGAEGHVGERSFYGLIFKNCHQFCNRCVNYVVGKAELSITDHVLQLLPETTIEPTMAALKRAARTKLGATKWRLWDWANEEGGEGDAMPEPDWQAHIDHFHHLALDAEGIKRIRDELEAVRAYEKEISDEAIPQHIRERLGQFAQGLAEVSQKYDDVKAFLGACPDARFSYADLQNSDEDFAGLAAVMQNNARIKDLARKMGRNYISEEQKRKARVPQMSRNEVYGIHRSDDLMRVLPSELLNLEDDTLETLFYARLLEKNLLSYQHQGFTLIDGEEAFEQEKRTGPVVACLDTSGSMQGQPILKAKALLLAIANILKKERRSLHVILFGATGELREFSLVAQNDLPGLLRFLRQGFGGGTDFETPMRRAMSIIVAERDYKKADVLMISDGDCGLSADFSAFIRQRKALLDCSVYTVHCAGARVQDSFSDECVVL